MADPISGTVVGAFQQLPALTPWSAAQEERAECIADDAGARLVRDTPVDVPKVAQSSIAAAGENGDPESGPATTSGFSDLDRAGRSAVNRAIEQSALLAG